MVASFFMLFALLYKRGSMQAPHSQKSIFQYKKHTKSIDFSKHF